jgi:hypothetical protein
MKGDIDISVIEEFLLDNGHLRLMLELNSCIVLCHITTFQSMIDPYIMVVPKHYDGTEIFLLPDNVVVVIMLYCDGVSSLCRL